MTKRRIVLFKGELDTLNLFSAQLKKGFEELGEYEIYEFDLRDMIKGLGGLYTLLQEGPITAMIFAFIKGKVFRETQYALLGNILNNFRDH